MGKFTIERAAKVYDEDSGESVYVGPDADGLDLVELRFCDADGKIAARLPAIQAEMAIEVAKAILELYGPKPVAGSSMTLSEYR